MLIAPFSLGDTYIVPVLPTIPPAISLNNGVIRAAHPQIKFYRSN